MKTYQFNIYRKLIKAALCTAACGGFGFSGLVSAAESSSIAKQWVDSWERASDSELDQLRGGFVLPNGVSIDFSVARVSSLNGSVVSSSFFQVPENVLLLQNGTMNQASDLAGAGFNSAVQNSVDNQVIRTVTDINIAVSNLKNMNLNNNGIAFSNFISPGAH